MSAEPVVPPVVRVPTAINRLAFAATCDFPPVVNLETMKPVYGGILRFSSGGL